MSQVAFCERIEASDEHLEDLDTARLITRYQSGAIEEFSTLYARYFDRVYGYLRVVVKDRHEAEDIAQQVFMKLMERLPEYERRTQPFRAWLFIVVRNQARDHLRSNRRIDPMEPGELNEHQDRTGNGSESAPDPDTSDLRALSWITNQDLITFIERLPDAQRQVLALRFMLGMQINEIADVLETTSNHVSVLQYRALSFLRDRLTALGREPERRGRTRMARCPRKAPVLRLRRFALERGK